MMLEISKILLPLAKDALPAVKEWVASWAHSGMRAKLCAVACLLSIGASVWLVYTYLDRSTKYEDIVRSTLHADLEATPQRFKGVEAFLMSNIEPGLHQKLGALPLSNSFIDKCNALQKKIADFKYTPNTTLRLPLSPGKNEKKVFTDDSENSYLFLPLYLLGPVLQKSSKNYFETNAPGTNENVIKDIVFSRYIEAEVNDFEDVPVPEFENQDSQVTQRLRAKPEQIYWISKNGINRIFGSKGKRKDFFGSMFPATTFFPSRPYFWPAFECHGIARSGMKVKDFFTSLDLTWIWPEMGSL